MTELGEVLRAIADGQKKVPGKMADLTEYDPMMPTATAALRTGEIVYLWGASYQAGGAAVVAHEKKTPTDGGAVLLQDGTVKTMTAAEFAAAPKAGKK